jgi:nitrogen fixation NifU-like protein
MYNEKVLEYFQNPKNVGELDDPDGTGEIGNASCGDIMRITIAVENGVISDIKFKTFGCAAAIASSSMITEMVKGMSLEEALKVTNSDVAEKLGGLPEQKLHCSNLAADALRAAIENYRERANGRGPKS